MEQLKIGEVIKVKKLSSRANGLNKLSYEDIEIKFLSEHWIFVVDDDTLIPRDSIIYIEVDN